MQRLTAFPVAASQASPRTLDEALAVMTSRCCARFTAVSCRSGFAEISCAKMELAVMNVLKAPVIFLHSLYLAMIAAYTAASFEKVMSITKLSIGCVRHQPARAAARSGAQREP
jgi:hypothetical protein